MSHEPSNSQKLGVELQREIFERDEYTCQGCGKTLPCFLDLPAKDRRPDRGVLYLVVDHSKGPSDDPSNLQAMCWSCNSKKGGRGMNSFRLSVAMKQLGPCMMYYPSLSAVIGLKESIFLCQLIYWTPRGSQERGEGWIYKSVEEMRAETGLSYKEQNRVRRSLVESGLVEEDYVRDEHRLYFRVVAEKLDEVGSNLGGHLPNGHMPKGNQPPYQREGGTLPKGRSIKEAEITQRLPEPTSETDSKPENQDQTQLQNQTQRQPCGAGIDIEKRRAEIADKERRRAAKAFKKKHPKWRLPAELREPEEEIGYTAPDARPKSDPTRKESAIEARSRRNREAIDAVFDSDDEVGRILYRHSLSMSTDLVQETAETWKEFIGDKEPEFVEKAFKVCLKRSDRFFPKPNEVLAEIERVETREKPEESVTDYFARQELKRKRRPE